MSRLSLEQQTLPRLAAVDGNNDQTTSYDESQDEKNSNEKYSGDADHPEGPNGTQQLDDAFWEPAEGVKQDDGVTRIEALYIVFGKGVGLYALWFSIGLIAYVYALSQSTTYYCEYRTARSVRRLNPDEQFATSSFGSHTILGTISVICSIMGGVAKPFVAKVSATSQALADD